MPKTAINALQFTDSAGTNPSPVQQLEKEGPVWIEAISARTYSSSQYGDVAMTTDKLQKFIANFNENARGQDIAIDFNHGQDKAKGDKAAGWYKEFAIRPSSTNASVPSLWARVEFTDEAKKEIADKQWKYHSLEWSDNWTNNDGASIEDVILGGALTNRPVAKGLMPINFSELFGVGSDDVDAAFAQLLADDYTFNNETKEWEHSEPGTGSPPAPRTDDDGSDDDAIGGGWRRDTPAIAKPEDVIAIDDDKKKKEGSLVTEFVFAEKDAIDLIRTLGLPSDVKGDKVVEEVKKMFGELAEFRTKIDATEQEKQFAEKYPQFWAEHNKLMERDRNANAKTFSEGVARIYKPEGMGLKATKQQLSIVALEKVAETHRKFADGTVTVEDYETAIKAITNGGIVQFGEIGTSESGDIEVPDFDTSTANGVAGARKAFGEVVNKLQKDNPEWDYKRALSEASVKHPDLAAAYAVTLPA